jgi:hypothetical protein
MVFSYVGRGLAKGKSPAKGVLSKYLKGFIVSEVNYEYEQARGVIRETYKQS